MYLGAHTVLALAQNTSNGMVSVGFCQHETTC
uniref:Uncharacterized protein n=1 Tax=Anguilla anguilla TaxID=7936 RepID=A0A0E9RES6_ANGAN